MKNVIDENFKNFLRKSEFQKFLSEQLIEEKKEELIRLFEEQQNNKQEDIEESFKASHIYD